MEPSTWRGINNFGPLDDDARPVRWVADEFTRLWSPDAGWVRANQDDDAPEARYLRLDSTKPRTRLRWRPRLGLADALEWIVEWHRTHLAGRDMRAATEVQILRYETRTEGEPAAPPRSRVDAPVDRSP